MYFYNFIWDIDKINGKGFPEKKNPASRFPDFKFPGKKRSTNCIQMHIRQAFIHYLLT